MISGECFTFNIYYAGYYQKPADLDLHCSKMIWPGFTLYRIIKDQASSLCSFFINYDNSFFLLFHCYRRRQSGNTFYANVWNLLLKLQK